MPFHPSSAWRGKFLPTFPAFAGLSEWVTADRNHTFNVRARVAEMHVMRNRLSIRVFAKTLQTPASESAKTRIERRFTIDINRVNRAPRAAPLLDLPSHPAKLPRPPRSQGALAPAPADRGDFVL